MVKRSKSNKCVWTNTQKVGIELGQTLNKKLIIVKFIMKLKTQKTIELNYGLIKCLGRGCPICQ